MEHPQPAFDLLYSLTDNPESTIFADWWAREEIDAGKNDDIREHPEVWNYLELPDVLDELTETTTVTVQPFDGRANLNAFAIGLGLENITYEPAEFTGLVFEPEGYDATIIMFGVDIFIGVGETAAETREAVEHAIDRLDMLGIDDNLVFGDTRTAQAADFLD